MNDTYKRLMSHGNPLRTIYTTKWKSEVFYEGAEVVRLLDRIAELEARQIDYDRILVLAARWCDVKHDNWQEILSIATCEVKK
tara:strand:+ start:295 stop:543 length:249 start_codon:yes stop_codon:yes gene_type:complete